MNPTTKGLMIGVGVGTVSTIALGVFAYYRARPRLIEYAAIRARTTGVQGFIPEPLRTTIVTTFPSQLEGANAQIESFVRDTLSNTLP